MVKRKRKNSAARTEGFRKAVKLSIYDKLQKDIQDKLITCHDGQSVDWNFIRRIIERLKIKEPIIKQFLNFLRFLMDIFESYKIEDSCLVEDVLQYASLLALFWSMPNCPFEEERKLWFKHRAVYRKKNLLTFERIDDVMEMFPVNMVEEDTRKNSSIHLLRKIPTEWENYLGRNMVKFTDHYFHILWELTKRGELYLLSTLLKHGVLYLKPTKYHQSASFLEYTLVMLRYQRSSFRPRTLEVLKGVEILARLIDSRHVFLVPPITGVSCFMKIFDSIPDLFIKVQEVREALEEVVRRVPEKLDFARVEPLCKEFERYFPESTGPQAPRSLQHQSRCHIRECLRKVRGLPYKVSSLPIPIYLQKYIHLER